VEPGFELYTTAEDNNWGFAMPDRDSTSHTWDIAASPAGTAFPGVWAHVAASYDPAAAAMTLYVNGTVLGTMTHVKTTWNATGPLDVGEFFNNGAHSLYFDGQISDVQTWNTALTPAQIADVSGMQPAAMPSGPLASAVPGECVDDPQGTLTSGTRVQIYACNGSPAQDWTLYPDGTIRPGAHTGVCVEVAQAGTAVGSLVRLYTCNSTVAQQWQTLPDGQVKNPHSGLCLADPGGTTTNSTQLTIETCDGSPEVTWSVPENGPAGQWPLDETTGTTAHDAVGANDATATSVTWGTATDAAGRTMPAATLNGTGALTTQHWGVDTTASFSVSAWVRVTDLTKYQTVLSEGGTANYAFALYYSPVYQAWVFSRSATDTDDLVLVRSISTDNPAIAAPATNVWTHLTGIYDATTNPAQPTVRLYVNGQLASNVNDPYTAWDARDHLDIAQDLHNGAIDTTGRLSGSLADVRRYDRALTDQQAYALYTSTS
jgi:hypothetical protein